MNSVTIAVTVISAILLVIAFIFIYDAYKRANEATAISDALIVLSIVIVVAFLAVGAGYAIGQYINEVVI